MATKESLHQRLIWIPSGVEVKGLHVPVVPLVPYPYKGKPERLWSLYDCQDQDVPPVLPLAPVHHYGAFIEDCGHDWEIVEGGARLKFFSQATSGGHWALLLFQRKPVLRDGEVSGPGSGPEALKLPEAQKRALRWLAGGWEVVQERGAVYGVNGHLVQLATLNGLAKAGLAEQYVRVPGNFPTHAFKVTAKGRQVAAILAKVDA